MTTTIMKNSMAICLALTIMVVHVYAQDSVHVQWVRESNGALTGRDAGRDLLLGSDGNCYVTGISFEETSKGQFTTLLYSPAGDSLWRHHYTGAATNKINIGKKLARTSDGFVYAVGTISDGAGDIGVIQYNTAGMQWVESYSPAGFGSYSDDGLDIATDAEGKVYVIGRVTSTAGSLDDVYTMRLNNSGAVEWWHQFSENSATDYPAAIDVSDDGHIYALTSSYNFWGSATHDISTIHYDPDGVQQWVSRYNGSGNAMDLATEIVVREPDMQYVTGTTTGEEDNMDYVSMLQNNYGTRLWVDTYAGSAGMDDTVFAVDFLPDGSAVITGRSYETVGADILESATTRCIHPDGTLAWSQQYFGPDGMGAAGLTVRTDSTGGVYVAGYTLRTNGYSDAMLIKYDSLGTPVWETFIDGAANLDDGFHAIVVDSAKNIYATGYASATSSDAAMLTVKYAQTLQQPGDTTSTTISASVEQPLTIFPNPARDAAVIQLPADASAPVMIIVADQLGRATQPTWEMQNSRIIKLNLENLSSGLLHIICTTQDATYSSTMIHIAE